MLKKFLSYFKYPLIFGIGFPSFLFITIAIIFDFIYPKTALSLNWGIASFFMLIIWWVWVIGSSVGNVLAILYVGKRLTGRNLIKKLALNLIALTIILFFVFMSMVIILIHNGLGPPS